MKTEPKTFVLTPEFIGEYIFGDTPFATLVVLTLRENMSQIYAAPEHCSHSSMARELRVRAEQVAFAGRIMHGHRHGDNVGFNLGGHSIEGFDPSYDDLEPRKAFRDSINAMLSAIGRGIVVFE